MRAMNKPLSATSLATPLLERAPYMMRSYSRRRHAPTRPWLVLTVALAIGTPVATAMTAYVEDGVVGLIVGGLGVVTVAPLLARFG